ncbi:MAG: hypothetical protein V7L31_13335 [Nostoc sp.]|uniref:hypothetical protein n=1 Tax=Nostoc sp. TaxID=1180 RepID=UPI002FF2C0F6
MALTTLTVMGQVTNGAVNAATKYSVTDLGVFNPSGINNAGFVVGTGNVDGNHPHAVLYSHGQLRDIGILPNEDASYATGINDLGQVVGYSEPLSQPPFRKTHAFIYSRGQLKDLGTFLGNYDSYAYAIDNAGQIVGTTCCSSGSGAFLFSNGYVRNLGFLPGGSVSAAYAIKTQGQAAGYSSSSTQPDQAVLFDNGKVQDLGISSTLGYRYSMARGINRKGQIVGLMFNQNESGNYHPFLYSKGKVQDLSTTKYPTGAAYGINNAGLVVGSAETVSGKSVAILYEHGQLFDLNTLISPIPGLVLEEARGINDVGKIVSSGRYGNGSATHAFLLTPVPK